MSVVMSIDMNDKPDVARDLISTIVIYNYIGFAWI